MYQLIVGEGGCPPDYFLYRMSQAEAEDYVEGMSRRHRQPWEQTRSLISAVCQILTGETPDMEFPWDEENPQDAVSEEELADLRKRAKEMERRLNNG